tara:strand:- start:6747 stop:7412 length:666 start_codon:yes stop_codon:yes gene_type:complete
MKKNTFLTILTFLICFSTNAQIQHLAGPRIGLTAVEPGLLANILRKDVKFFSDENTDSWDGTSLGQYGALMSQYGWQWESRFADGGNIVGLVEWVALVGGMEKGLFLPSVSSMVGIRTSSGIEFAAGPNLSLGGIAMVIGAGYNFRFGNLNLPVNIAYVPSMNKTYDIDAEFSQGEWIDPDGDPYSGDEYWSDSVLLNDAYTVTHPTGSRVTITVGFNLSK